jgi:rhomboid protease GluP
MLCVQSITLVSLNALSDLKSNQNNAGRPTLCRNCSAIVGAGQLECAVCGTSTVAQPEQAQRPSGPDRETVRFAKAILERPYKFTIILLILNLFAFLLMWESSGLASLGIWEVFPNEVLIVYGARLNRLVNAPFYQWWRLVVPMFLHVNLVHLMVNMYSLWIVGPYVEKLYGSAKFVFFWVVTGIASLLASYLSVQPGLHSSLLGRFLLKSFDGPSAGASGALFGMVGVLFVFGIRFRNELPEGFKRAFGMGMLPLIIMNLFIGYIGRGLFDNAAHLGGLVSGAALALIIEYRRPGTTSGRSIPWRFLQAAALILILVSCYKVGRYFNATAQMFIAQPLSTTDANEQIRLNYLATMTQGQETASTIIHDRDLSNVALTNQRLAQTPVPDAKAGELRDRLMTIITKLQNEVASKNGTPPPPIDTKLIEERNVLIKDYEEWLTGGSKTDASAPQK